MPCVQIAVILYTSNDYTVRFVSMESDFSDVRRFMPNVQCPMSNNHGSWRALFACRDIPRLATWMKTGTVLSGADWNIEFDRLRWVGLKAAGRPHDAAGLPQETRKSPQDAKGHLENLNCTEIPYDS